MPRTKSTLAVASDQEAAPVTVPAQLRKAVSSFIRFGTDETYNELLRLMNTHQASFVERFQAHRQQRLDLGADCTDGASS